MTCSLRLIVAMALPSKTSKLALGNFCLNLDIKSSAFSITRLPSFLSMVMQGTLGFFASTMPRFENAAVLQCHNHMTDLLQEITEGSLAHHFCWTDSENVTA